MFGVGGTLSDSESEENDHGCHNIADGIDGIGDQGKRVPNDPAYEFDDAQQQIHQQAEYCGSGDFFVKF